MLRNNIPCLILILAGTVVGCGRDAEDGTSVDAIDAGSSSVDAALATVTSDTLKAHLDYLASDARKGRMTGTAAYDAAAAYVADRFAALGL